MCVIPRLKAVRVVQQQDMSESAGDAVVLTAFLTQQTQDG